MMSPSARKIIVASIKLERMADRLALDFHVIRGWERQDPVLYLTAEVVIVAGDEHLDHRLLEMMPALRLVACATRGFDKIDTDWLRQAGIGFSSAGPINDEDVADHALGTIILHRRALMEGDRVVRSGLWTDGGVIRNRSLNGARLGIVGLGQIGWALAERAEKLRMEVEWWGPNAKDSPWRRAISLIELARTSEYLVVAARAHDNHGLISKAVLDALGPEGYLVNIARGQLVDEEALIEALKDRRISGAALDVFEHEPTSANRWAGVPNAFLTPHMSGKTTEAADRMTEHMRHTLSAFFARQSPGPHSTISEEPSSAVGRRGCAAG